MKIPKLYHYTNQKGILGIIESKKIWATGIQYLNDSKEMIYALSLFQEILFRKMQTAKPSINLFLKKIDKPLSILLENKMLTVYVFSVTEEPDLLSQWRGYCPDGNGYCIGLDLSMDTLSLLYAQGFSLIRCEYDLKIQKRLIERLISKTVNKFEKNKITKKETEKDIIANTIVDIIYLAAKLKHPSFEEEKEWRLISSPISIADTRVKYRQGKSSLIPYVEVHLTHSKNNLKLDEIIVWPKNDLVISALEGFLIKNHVVGKSKSRYIESKGKRFLIPKIWSSSITYRTF